MTPEEVLKWGISTPVYYWEGEIIDGRKLARSAALCGIQLPMQIDFESEEEAQRHLFAHHPKRALERWPCATASEAAAKFSAPLRKVAKHFQPKARPARKRPGSRRRTGAQTRGRLGGPARHIYISDPMWEQIGVDAASLNVSRAEYVRAAVAAVTPQQVRTKLITLAIAASSKR